MKWWNEKEYNKGRIWKCHCANRFYLQSDNGLIKALKKYGISYDKILLFARGFLMPEDLYDKSMVENTTAEGKFDCVEMAKDFGTGYMKVLTRGEDLGKWH